MPRLTLKECLTQPKGTEGRLYEVHEDDLNAWKSFDERVPQGGAYRVIAVNGNEMEIEAYIIGGSRKKVSNIPIAEREQDVALDSDFLLYNYLVTGKAGSNPETAGLCF